MYSVFFFWMGVDVMGWSRGVSRNDLCAAL